MEQPGNALAFGPFGKVIHCWQTLKGQSDVGKTLSNGLEVFSFEAQGHRLQIPVQCPHRFFGTSWNWIVSSSFNLHG